MISVAFSISLVGERKGGEERRERKGGRKERRKEGRHASKRCFALSSMLSASVSRMEDCTVLTLPELMPPLNCDQGPGSPALTDGSKRSLMTLQIFAEGRCPAFFRTFLCRLSEAAVLPWT